MQLLKSRHWQSPWTWTPPPRGPLDLSSFPVLLSALSGGGGLCWAVGINSSRLSLTTYSSPPNALSSIFPGGQASSSSSSSSVTTFPCISDFVCTHLLCANSPHSSGEFCFPRMLIWPRGGGGGSFPHSGSGIYSFVFKERSTAGFVLSQGKG